MLVPGLLPGLVPPLGAPPPEGAPPPVPCAAAKAVKRTRRIATCRMRCTACMWDLAFAPPEKQSALFKRGTPPSGTRRAGPDKRDYTAPAATWCRAQLSKRCNVQTSSYTGSARFAALPVRNFRSELPAVSINRVWADPRKLLQETSLPQPPSPASPALGCGRKLGFALACWKLRCGHHPISS